MRVMITLLVLAPAIQAQDSDWIRFTLESGHLVAPLQFLEQDVDERDYVIGDLDQDGRDDLIIVRKRPFMTTGRRENLLLMAEGDQLVDRTLAYASTSDVPGDLGFLTRTNDRDVILADINLDGWLDVITATTLSSGQTKAISHPRIYINLGLDPAGQWLGLSHEDARIPQLIAGGQAVSPRFCGVSAGDVTGNGYPDLYFSDYDENNQTYDLNDRLLINDGNGFFTDESSMRLTPNMLLSGFGTSSAIVDMNADGHADIVRNTGIGVSSGFAGINVHYNDPNNVGHFQLTQSAYQGAPYHVVVGDLNRDNLPDFAASDDGIDRYLLNTGTDPFGRVIWSPQYNFGNHENNFSTGSRIADMDGDGWPEILIGDMDPIFAGCTRRLKIYHNRGGVQGGFVDLTEEASDGYVAAYGLTASDMRGTWDTAVIDVDGDGRKDLVLGRCASTEVWIASAGKIGDAYCGPATLNSSGNPASIEAFGSTTADLNDLRLVASGMPVGQSGYFLTSQNPGFSMPASSQGNLCLGSGIGRFVQSVQQADNAGQFDLTVDLSALPPNSTPVLAGETHHFQAWFRDMNPASTSNFTDGVAIQYQ